MLTQGSNRLIHATQGSSDQMQRITVMCHPFQVANIKKETHIVWYKDDREIMVDEEHDFKDGVCTLLISEVSDYLC